MAPYCGLVGSSGRARGLTEKEGRRQAARPRHIACARSYHPAADLTAILARRNARPAAGLTALGVMSCASSE
jgi:hypothetical protein